MRFDGGQLTSDGGVPWVAQAAAAPGVCAAPAAGVPGWRRGGVRHSPASLVRRRVFQIACGYGDQDDATTRRADPLVKLARGRLPASEADLASQPTLSRLENAVDRRASERLAAALADVYIRERGRAGAPARLVLDRDGTDDPAHGEPEGVRSHGYYRRHAYHPLLAFDGDTGHLITAVPRPGNVHGSRFVVLVLRRLLRTLRAAGPDVPIEGRADSGFATPRLFAGCEANRADSTIGLIPNPVRERLAAPPLEEARARSRGQGGAKVRLADAARYQADAWPRPRRVVFKAALLAKGPDTRFVVTTRPDEPLAPYDWYVDRGAAEDRIEDLEHALAADRLADHRFWANALRLRLHAAAFRLLDTRRRWLRSARAPYLQLASLRLRVSKLGGWVRERTGFGFPEVCVHLSSHHPRLPPGSASPAPHASSPGAGE